MRRTTIALFLAMAPGVLGAQARDTILDRQSLPRDVRREVVERWNAPMTGNGIRSSDRVEIEEGREVRGDVIVQHGPLIIAGRVTGNVLAVNSDVLLKSTARIDGDVLVVGGEVEGRNVAYVGGEIRIYRQSLRYRTEGDRIIADRPDPRDETDDESWWRRWDRRRSGSWADPLRIAQGGAYNRVEGLPINVGPVIYQRFPDGSFRLDASAVLRTASSFNHDDSDVGFNIRGEMRYGRRSGVGIGGRAFDVVDPVESWQLTDNEVALASFLFHRDYRDYFQRHGGSGFVTLYGGPYVSVTGAFSEERWTARTLNDPFTLFRNGAEWRPNPLMDEGRFHIASANLRVDTRTDPNQPWSGWYLNADFESGRGRYASVALTSQPRTAAAGSLSSYTRGFADLRRYNRLAPDAQLNVRLVAGGWMNGDELPLERRLSVETTGALPGFDFRSPRAGVDVGTCGTLILPGRPAQCDRIALAQVEYRTDLNLIGAILEGIFDSNDDWRVHRGRHYNSNGAAWVLFADAGRGWRVGTPPATDDGLTYDSNTIPPLSTFRTDAGIGFDFGDFGVYCAKSLSKPAEPANFFVRLRHRF